MDSSAGYLALCLMSRIPVFFMKWPFVENLCSIKMAYWAKMYATILTRAAHWKTLMRAAHLLMAYFDLSKLNLA